MLNLFWVDRVEDVGYGEARSMLVAASTGERAIDLAMQKGWPSTFTARGTTP